MIIHQLDASPPSRLQRALDEFEASFLTPFAPGRMMRISYGADRTGFIRTLGDGRCIVSEHEGRVLALMELATVNLLLPDGSSKPAVYIADVKVRPEARKKLVTARLLQKGNEWAKKKSDLWFTVTMDTTPMKPSEYTGRTGLPAFAEVARLAVVRLPVVPVATLPPQNARFSATAEAGVQLYKRLVRGRYGLLGGTPKARSAETPAWMVHPSGLACARFEDRRKVRRLIADDGTELRPAYLSCFAFQDQQAAIALIVAAVARAGTLGYRALRFCLPPEDLAKLKAAFNAATVQINEGGIFATSTLQRGIPWNLNAAEV